MSKRPNRLRTATYNVLHLFCGSGGGALGFKRARAQVGDLEGTFETIGGVDVDPEGIEDFRYLVGVDGTVIDLFTREDYIAFHSKWERGPEGWTCTRVVEPPEGWREATPEDIRAACGGRSPHVVFLSPPCKGVSQLLPGSAASSPKYAALNRLIARGLFLVMEAFADDPPALILLENVPFIRVRGRELVDLNVALLQAYGYAVQETVHDAGVIGGLAQRRLRFLFVARHTGKVRPFLYEPPKKPLRPISSEIFKLPLPFDPSAGPMHRLSTRMDFLTWLRLALIPAGKDWKALRSWAPETFRLGRTPFNNVFRVVRLDEPSPTVTGGATPTAGGIAVPDPRLAERANRFSDKYAVQDPGQPARTITGVHDIQVGAPCVADPRLPESEARRANQLRVESLDEPAHAVTGARLGSGAPVVPDPRMSLPENSVTLRVKPTNAPAPPVTSSCSVWDSGGYAVDDPRITASYNGGVLGVLRPEEPANAITGRGHPTCGRMSTPDPRVLAREWNGGVLGVQDPTAPSTTVMSQARPSNGSNSVVDARLATGRPDHWPAEIPIIISPHDGTVHRPLTALERAVLQSLPAMVNGTPLKLAGNSVTRWDERIGNMVPPDAAQAIAETMLRTLLAEAASQEILAFEPVWVAPPRRDWSYWATWAAADDGRLVRPEEWEGLQ